MVTNYEIHDLERFVHTCGLVDLRSVGCRLTWTNGTVSSKLDRTLVNSHWLLADYESYAEFIAPGCLSDHSCSIVTTLAREGGLNRPFKFFNMWTLHEDFQGLVKTSSEEPANENAQYRLKEKLRRLKGKLRSLDKHRFQHISEQAKRAKKELEEAQHGLLAGGEPSSEYGTIRRKATILVEAEKSFYQQRVKSVYLKNSDRNTKFFHDLVKRNNKRNAIITLTK